MAGGQINAKPLFFLFPEALQTNFGAKTVCDGTKTRCFGATIIRWGAQTFRFGAQIIRWGAQTFCFGARIIRWGALKTRYP